MAFIPMTIGSSGGGGGSGISGFKFIGETTSSIGTTARSITLTESMENYDWIIFAMGRNSLQTLANNSAKLVSGSILIKRSAIGSSLSFTSYTLNTATPTTFINVTISSNTSISVKANAATSITGFSVIGVKS